MAKLLMVLGAFIFSLGSLFWLAQHHKSFGRWLSWFGRLPGDVQVERPGFTFFAPLGSSIVLSVAFSLLLSFIFWFLRK